MDFELDHEQRLLQQGVERLLADFYAPGRRTTHAASDPGYSTALWRHYADLGVLALDCTGDGGERGDLVHMMTTMEAAGRMLALEPYLGTVVQCASLLRIAGTGTQRGQWLPAIASGDATVAFAHAEHGARYALQQVATRARREHDDWVIDGEKVLVRNGDSADALIVSARIAGADDDRDGIALFVVPSAAKGLTRNRYPLYDGHRAAACRFDGVRLGAAALLGVAGAGALLVERAHELGIVALTAEAVGCMDALMALTLDYLKTRKQFGRPLGSFQALQHRAVDMHVAIEQARSMMLFATMMAGEPDPVRRAPALAAAKVQIGRSARAVGQEAIQLHGGIGMAQEYAAGHYFKRLTAIDTWCGDADHHLQQLVALGGLLPPGE